MSTVLFGNEAWPTGSSPGAFARDVFRLEGCVTDRDKAMALNKWMVRCMQRGPVMRVPRASGWAEGFEPGLIFNSWGHYNCTGWGWIAVEAMQANGLKARRSVVKSSGHTFYEVSYADPDGKEAWHAFDPYLGWYYLNDAGDVASCEELAANADLTIHPRGGGRQRLGHHPERSSIETYNNPWDNLDIVQPLFNDEYAYDPQPGQAYANLWRPELPNLAWHLPKYPGGPHCDISLYDEEGLARYPEHVPFWKNYVWPTEDHDGINGNQPVRWHGCGALRWKPLDYGDAVTFRSANAVFEKGMLRPSGSRKHCEVWWHVKLPYLATYLRINSAIDGTSADKIGFAFSPDAGRSVTPIHWGNGAPPAILLFGNAPDPAKPAAAAPEGPTVRGLREFWLRLDMSTQSTTALPRVRALQFTVGYQLNMNLLPRLLPGDNDLYLRASDHAGGRLTAQWAYTHPGGEGVETLSLDKSGSANRKVKVTAERPEEIIMRGVTLRCE